MPLPVEMSGSASTLILTDTHCHLDFDLFDQDRREVINRAWESGLERILNPGIDVASSQNALQLADSHPKIFSACGVHPNDATGWNSGTMAELRELASHPKVVAIGEIGLDYYRERAPHDLQKKILKEQLGLAAEFKKPVIIHNRNATSDLLEILFNWHEELVKTGSPLAEHPGVLHSYGDRKEAALMAIARNFFIGFTGPVTFKNAPELRQTIAALPVNHILIETDSPFLTPHPYRGQRNEPAYVRYVAEKIAEIYNLPVESVGAQTTANASRLFNW